VVSITGAMRPFRALRAAAWGVVVVGAAVPLARRRLRIPPPVVIASAAAAPVALSIAARRSRARDVGVCALQMWAYIATYQIPHDDPEALEARVHIDYPVSADRAIGLGTLPTLRLQRALAKPGALRPADQALVWVHWIWFLVPHGTVAYILLRHPERFPAAAARIYAVFDLGVSVYWAVPTAPPWYAAEHGRIRGAEGEAAMRRIMVEQGEAFWKERWQPLYSFLGGNPLAAMPSLHFATSLMAARVLAEAGPVEGAVGWTYALTLGFALVYLGEHYVIDLLAGAALAEGVRRAAPAFAPAARALSRGVQRLEAVAHVGSAPSNRGAVAWV
jgi:membrane-associated phospholipid phosphatase